MSQVHEEREQELEAAAADDGEEDDEPDDGSSSSDDGVGVGEYLVGVEPDAEAEAEAEADADADADGGDGDGDGGGTFPGPDRIVSGMEVEYASEGDGEKGSFYRGTVLRVAGAHATLRHAIIVDDAGAHPEERVPLKLLRPVPPPTPRAFFAKLKKGQRLELSYLDGYWEVVLKRVLPSGQFRVEAPLYGAVHTVARDQLRPCWKWTVGAWAVGE